MSPHEGLHTTSLSSMWGSTDVKDYHALLSKLLAYEHVFYSPSTSPHRLQITQHQQTEDRQDQSQLVPTIASLSLHPVIESLLHILNCDLPSAHFLCRHAEVKPKWESMFVHGMLHRIEGDIDNSRAWYRQVKEANIFRHVWYDDGSNRRYVPQAAQSGWEHFLDRVERYRDRSKRRAAMVKRNGHENRLSLADVKDWKEEAKVLREASLWEIRQTLDFCEHKFGLLSIADARQEFLGRIESGDMRLAKVAEGMVTGGEGWRIF